MSKARIASAYFTFLLLSGCGDDTSSMHCPDKGKEFFEESVKAYFLSHPPIGAGTSITILDGASYDSSTNWWIVPIDIGKQKWNALLSCDGHLELSGRL